MVSVRLPDTMLAKLEDVASKTGRSRNELVQMCIDYALARLEITEEYKQTGILILRIPAIFFVLGCTVFRPTDPAPRDESQTNVWRRNR